MSLGGHELESYSYKMLDYITFDNWWNINVPGGTHNFASLPVWKVDIPSHPYPKWSDLHSTTGPGLFLVCCFPFSVSSSTVLALLRLYHPCVLHLIFRAAFPLRQLVLGDGLEVETDRPVRPCWTFPRTHSASVRLHVLPWCCDCGRRYCTLKSKGQYRGEGIFIRSCYESSMWWYDKMDSKAARRKSYKTKYK